MRVFVGKYACSTKDERSVNIWHDISASCITPEELITCIKISSIKNKYELNKEAGKLVPDRLQYWMNKKFSCLT